MGLESSAIATSMRYRHSGLILVADRALPGLLPAPSSSRSSADLTFELQGTEPVPRTALDGTFVARSDGETRSRYSGVRLADGRVLFRAPGELEVRFDRDLDRISYQVDPSVEADRVADLLAGDVLALALLLRRVLVLHASTVDYEGQGIAFVGHSGMGKSTLSLAACIAGARLVSEDTTAVDGAPYPGALPGHTDVRLRKRSLDLATAVPNWPRVETCDGRHAVQPPMTRRAAVPLDLLVLPRPSRRAERIDIRPLSAMDALIKLLAFPRLRGVRVEDLVESQFRGHARLAANAQVIVMTVPWRPPFTAQLGSDVLAASLPYVRRAS